MYSPARLGRRPGSGGRRPCSSGAPPPSPYSSAYLYRYAMLLGMVTDEGSAGQRDPGDPAAAGAALYALVAAVVRRGPREMSLTSLSTLATLDRTGPRRITDLAVIQGVAQPSMTVLVTALERSGLVERRGDPADRRVSLVSLTAAGADLLGSQRRAGAAALGQLIAKLPADEAAALAAATPALRHLRELDSEQREPAPGAPHGGSQ
jgi:DNA-binding MarR family transcriptional regulator